MLRLVIFSACLLCIVPKPVLSLSADQKAVIHKHFEEIAMECIKDNPITEDDIKNLKAKQKPTGEHAPCFMACVLKKCGVMNDQGKLEQENAAELVKKVFSDEEEIKNVVDYLHSCSHVNDAPVGDGDKGCDRAMLALECMNENSSKFGFDL